ncbi:MAG: hypothetical protein FJ216_09720 [Ignavibacteria bacterium]|nr:hypothetical protein [Ignavibacteria bacterium]
MDYNNEYYKDFVQVDVYGITLSSAITTRGYAILLKEIDGDRRLPIIIGEFEAQAIALELQGEKPHRPLTHDLIKQVLQILGYNIEAIFITELKDSTFYAKIRLDDNTIEDIDSRPSDAIALALKFGAPIYVSIEIMDEIAFTPKQSDKETSESIPEAERKEKDYELRKDDKPSEQTKEKKISQLKILLEEAVKKEDYERAAILRDELKKLDLSNFN